MQANSLEKPQSFEWEIILLWGWEPRESIWRRKAKLGGWLRKLYITFKQLEHICHHGTLYMYIHSIDAVCFCFLELPGAETSCYPKLACSLACGESQLLLKSSDVLRLIENTGGWQDGRAGSQSGDPAQWSICCSRLTLMLRRCNCSWTQLSSSRWR